MPKSLNSIDAFNYSLNRLQVESPFYQLIPVVANSSLAAATTTATSNLSNNLENNKEDNIRITTPSQLIRRYSNSNTTNNANKINKDENESDISKINFISSSEFSQIENQAKQVQEIMNKPDDEYIKLKLNDYKNSLTKIMANRYITEPFLMQQTTIYQQNPQQQHHTFQANSSNQHKTTNSNNNSSSNLQARLNKTNIRANTSSYIPSPSQLIGSKPNSAYLNRNTSNNLTSLINRNTNNQENANNMTQNTPRSLIANNINNSSSNNNNNIHEASLKKPNNVVIYGKNIDNLTVELLAALSNGINKNLLIPDHNNNKLLSSINKSSPSYSKMIDELNKQKQMQKRQLQQYSKQCQQSSNEDVPINDLYENELDMYDNENENYSDEDEAFIDEDADEEYEDENLLYADYEDERIIFGTNISQCNHRDNYENEDNIVMKICNEIKSYQLEDQNDLNKLDDAQKLKLNRNRLRKLKSSRRQSKGQLAGLQVSDMPLTADYMISSNSNSLNNFNLLNNLGIQIDLNKSENTSILNNKLRNESDVNVPARADNLNADEYQASYFDKKLSNQEFDLENDDFEYEYEYTEVLHDDFRKVFDKYDASLTADQFIKQSLPPAAHYLPKLQNKSINKRVAREKSNVEPTPTVNKENEQEKSGEQESQASEENPKEPSSNNINQEDSGISSGSNSLTRAANQEKEKEPKEKKEPISNPRNPPKTFDMYHILKRMMVKKKYALATIKQEKESNNKKMKIKRNNTLPLSTAPPTANANNNNSNNNNGGLQKQRPSTAAINLLEIQQLQQQNQIQQQQQQQQLQQQNQTKLSRPRTVNIIPIKLNDGSSENNEIATSFDINYKNALDEDFFYEPFRISPTTITNQQWPFEVDYDKPKVNRKQSSKSKNSNNSKCYTCKKLPVIKSDQNLNSLDNSNQNQIGRIYTLNQQQQQSQSAQNLPQNQLNNEQNKIQRKELNLQGTGQISLLPSNNNNNNYNNNNSINTNRSITNFTYNAMRRCVSAKLQPQIAQIQSKSYDGTKYTLDNDDANRNNYNSDYEIDKEIDDEDTIYSKKNLLVNKEEQLRKMTLIPGKTFKSQRRKSISIDHVPVSTKKIELQKNKIPLAPKSSFKSQQQQPIPQPLPLNQAHLIIHNQQHPKFISNSRNLSDSSTAKLANLTLAIQHQEEIYSLIDNKAIKKLSNVGRHSAKSKSMNNEITTILYKKTNKLNSKSKRPKTSKT